MASAKQARLRVGVIGLGRLWETRHKPAFARLMDRIRPVAVYDQVARRAEIEANVLGCDASTGIASLVGRDDLDAIYLLAPQWFGLHALAVAARSGRPIYCALPLVGGDRTLDEIDRSLQDSGAVFMPEFARRTYPATVRLRELLATRLGPARLVVGLVRLAGFDRYGQPGPSTQIAPAPLLVDPGGYLLDWCRCIFGAEPVRISRLGGSILPGAAGEADHDVEAIAAEFEGGRIAQFTVTRHPHTAWSEAARSLPAPGLQVFAERGTAWLELPDRIVWTDAEGSHDERLPLEPSIGETLNLGFLRAVAGGGPARPDWSDALTVANLLSRLEGVRGEAVRPPTPRVT